MHLSKIKVKLANISIHALREEGDEFFSGFSFAFFYFYPRPPRGGRRAGARSSGRTPRISIHALREEGDQQDVLADLLDR